MKNSGFYIPISLFLSLSVFPTFLFRRENFSALCDLVEF